MTQNKPDKNLELLAEYKALRNENKSLKQLLLRKDKVLAETPRTLVRQDARLVKY